MGKISERDRFPVRRGVSSTAKFVFAVAGMLVVIAIFALFVPTKIQTTAPQSPPTTTGAEPVKK